MTVNKHIRFQRAFWLFAQIFVGTAVRVFNNYHCKVTKPQSRAFLALYNHTDDMDPFYLAIGLFRHMRYVASSVILEGFIGKIISFLVGPIPRRKAASADDTVALMLENLKAGISIALSAEGNRSWDGETMFISPRTAEVAKQSGAALVTFRIRGGYLHTPRYAAYARKGPVFGEMVREYSPEELAGMSVQEISDAIYKDLYVNAYQDQKDPPPIIRHYLKDRKMVTYKGRAKAENIESILYICPKCHGIGSLSSHDDSFECTCGLSGRVNDYGFLEGDLPFDNTVDWNRWQKQYLKEHVDAIDTTTDAIFTDHGADLHITRQNERQRAAKSAEVLFYPDRIVIRDDTVRREFRLDEITRFAAFRSQKVFFTCRNSYCELTFDHIVSGMKYEAFWRMLTGRPYL